MKITICLIALTLIVAGCATRSPRIYVHQIDFKPPTTLDDRREQILCIQYLIKEQINELYHIQDHLKELPHAKYDTNAIGKIRDYCNNPEAKAKDLDAVLKILISAEQRLAEQNTRLHNELGILND